MKIALDYDETVTLDRGLWGAFIEIAKFRKHEVVIVTSRPPNVRGDSDFNEDIEMYAKGWGVSIVYCNGDQKATRFKADVWIDDSPQSIPTYAQMHVEQA